MSVLGVGIDLVELARFEHAVERWGEALLRRVFTDGELGYAGAGMVRMERLAGRFAVKEAALKALGAAGGRGPCPLRAVEVVRGVDGVPSLCLTGAAREAFRAVGATRSCVSLSHTGTAAVAVVLLESAPG